jgi:hypothetical protein
MSHIKPFSRRVDIVVQEFADEILIYDLRADKAFNLNLSAALVWQLSNGDKTIAEIADEIAQKLGSPLHDEFVWLALEQLRKAKLLENELEIARLLQGVSRRKTIKKVGLASLVSLPLVSALIVPQAVEAQSSTCTTASPGGTLCRCFLTDAPALGDNCGTNYAAGDFCNPGCSCRRTAVSCPTTGPLAGTCQGTCV